ncbi:MAG TPA: energy transducer TonB [Candidatus Acidoferrum sp.]|nr:energy transducer TonB [Candidatus Acidoferrum sp.]
MRLNKHEQVKPNMAGLTSQTQQAEMKLILAGRWPPLKPLPVFKYETDEYRASIDFDKTRGEWVCRKTSLPSNKIQELRGGLTEITTGLPHGPAKVFTEAVVLEQQEQEFEKEAYRRLRAILEWRENYENGALYSELQGYLSENQQDEIDDSIRLTLTARQLQFNAKNVAYVFDALSKAGGRLATLIEIAQRKKAQEEAGAQEQTEAVALEAETQAPCEAIYPKWDRRLHTRASPAARVHVELGDTNGGTILNISETGMAVAAADLHEAGDYLPRIRLQLPSTRRCIEVSGQIVWLGESKKDAGVRFVDLTADARNQISNWIASEKPTPEFEGSTPATPESLIPATLENFPTDPIERVFREQDQAFAPAPITPTPFQASKIVTPEIPDTSRLSLVEDLQERVRHDAPITGVGPLVRTGKIKPSADRIEGAPSRSYVLKISGSQVAAIVFLFAVISFAVGLTLARNPLGKRLRDAQKSILSVDATPSAVPNRPGEPVTSRSVIDSDHSSVSNKLDDATPSEEKPKESTLDSASFAKAPFTDLNSSPAIEAKPSANTEAKPERNNSTGLIARNAPSPVSPKPAYSPKAVGPIKGAQKNPAPRRVKPAKGGAPYPSRPPTILVSAPAEGSKPFRVFFQEKAIAATSSYAMTSQLSVLVSPEPGPAMAHQPARLQAGELVSWVWPRYPRPGDRYGSAETVKVRTTVGQLGQVLDIKLVSGSSSLLPATMSAIRQWRYKPTLLNNTPVQAQQDVTIEFRPPLHLSHVHTQHPSHN